MAGNPLQIHFFAPKPDDFPSGGNRYNAALTLFLNKQGISASIGPEIPAAVSHVLVDSLFLNQWNPSGREFLLVHYLPGMELGLPAQIPSADEWRGAVVTGDHTRGMLLENGWPPEKVILLYPGLPDIPLITGPSQNHLSILWVGNLIPGKGIMTFLENLIPYYSNLKRLGVKVKLAGSNQMDIAYAKECLLKVTKLKPVIEYLGPLSPREMMEAYQNATIFLSTSRFETFGMAILEARAAGLPVITLPNGLGVHPASALNVCEGEEEIVDLLLRLAQYPSELKALRDRSISERRQLASQFPTWDIQSVRLTDFISIG